MADDETVCAPDAGYISDLHSLDRSSLLYLSYCVHSNPDSDLTQALYRQRDGSTKIHVVVSNGSDIRDENFIEVLDREGTADFLRQELAFWRPEGHAN